MRNLLLIAGAAVLIAGALLTAGVFKVKDTREVLRIGGASINYTEEKAPDRNIGYALMGLGVLGLLAGIARRR